MKNENNQEQLDQLRHSAAHLLAAAVVKIWPEAKPTIGPSIENGFYYDFDFGDVSISDKDLKNIQKTMKKMVNKWDGFKKEEISSQEAKKVYASNPYKLELIDELEKEGEIVSFYKSGDFIDLCRGGHVDKPNQQLKFFKLLSIAGAYWRGDEKNKMLTRIYGTAFFTAEELNQHLKLIEEAKKRDHRKIGKNLELFMFDQEVGQGLPLYLPNGAIVRHLLMNFALDTYLKRGYQMVSTPHIGSEKLWIKSGHIGFYDDSMYGPLTVDDEKYRLKPMNCPFHVKMYTSKKRSYKNLPVRWTEMGTVYRYEKSGELHGLTRPRGFTQDDAHIICTPNQLQHEIDEALNIIDYIYQTLGMKELKYKLSTRDPQNPDKYVGSDQEWSQAENTLKQALKEKGISDYETDIGGAAFYAPKIDIDAVDSMNRRWQLSTIQIDFNLPTRFNMTYIDKDGQEKTPFMIHRALLGSLERFLGVYIEHTNGAFPVWLSPIQAVIMPISESHLKYSQTLYQNLKNEGVRVEIWPESNSLQKRIRTAEKQKIPYMLIIGDKEIESDSVSVRSRGQVDLGVIKLADLIDKIKENIKSKSLKIE